MRTPSAALAKIEKIAADALEGNRNESHSDNEALVMMASALAEIEQEAHYAQHPGTVAQSIPLSEQKAQGSVWHGQGFGFTDTRHGMRS